MKKIASTLLFFVTLFAQNNAFAENPQSVTSFTSLDGRGPAARYNRNILNHATEYPIAANQSLGGTLQASHIAFKNNDQMNSKSSYALNSAEIFHRYRFLRYKKLAISVGNLYRFPGIYNENDALGLGVKESDYELRFFFGYNMQERMTNQVIRGTNTYFMRPEIAYRRRFGRPFDEVRFSFTGGLKIHQKFLLLFENDITWNVASKANVNANSYSNPSNFQFSKNSNNMSTTSLIYRYNNEIALQFGYVKRLSGNDDQRDARGLVFGLWTSF